MLLLRPLPVKPEYQRRSHRRQAQDTVAAHPRSAQQLPPTRRPFPRPRRHLFVPPRRPRPLPHSLRLKLTSESSSDVPLRQPRAPRNPTRARFRRPRHGLATAASATSRAERASWHSARRQMGRESRVKDRPAMAALPRSTRSSTRRSTTLETASSSSARKSRWSALSRVLRACDIQDSV